MEIHQAIQLLIKLKDEGNLDIIEHLSANLTTACELMKLDVNEIRNLPTIKQLCGNFHAYMDRTSTIWNYVCFSFHLLIDKLVPEKPEDEDSDDDEDPEGVTHMLSVAQQKNIRTLLEIILVFGLVPNLIPGVGITLNTRSQFASKIPRENISIIDKYIRLRVCTAALIECLKHAELSKCILSRHLNDLLAALFQLSFAPLKKPSNHVTSAACSSTSSSAFQISEEMWVELQKDRVYFKNSLIIFLNSTYQPTLIKELMVLMGLNAPKWLKSEISKVLCNLLMKKDGVMSLVRAIFDTNTVDTGSEWKQMEVIQKLILDIGGVVSAYTNFYKNICAQITKMLSEVGDDVTNNSKNLFLILPRLFIKSIIDRRKDIFVREIFDYMIEPIFQCTKIPIQTEEPIVTQQKLNQSLLFLYQIFGVEINTKCDISTQEFLLPYVDVFYQIHVKMSELKLETKFTKAILNKILSDANFDQLTKIIQLLVFRNNIETFHKFNGNLDMDDNLNIKWSGIKINYKMSDSSYLENIIDSLSYSTQAKIFKIVFGEFVNTFTTTAMETSRSDLLNLETSFEACSILPLVAENKLILLKILAKLAENKSVMAKIDVNILMKFIVKLFRSFEHQTTDEFDKIEPLFISLMLLDILIDNSIEPDQLRHVINPLEAISEKTKNTELKAFISKTVAKIRNGTSQEEESAFQDALNQICDPILPVRAHGLMQLTKLIEMKDKETISRLQYVLCIFQENLKDEDSYVYLSAVNGIAALAYAHTDTVLEVLTEEYVLMKTWKDTEETQRVRMELGEVLVRVTKRLGEMAPKYKSVLLNAFLQGAKDYDHLIRTSSLSNLGQVCEVLGYKLGIATPEILQCLERVIETDPAIEAKRAAVMVLYQLIKGLGPDTLVFLKDALLPIYRTLKNIYVNNSDTGMKLHAQLALEELNNATRNFLMPPQQVEKTLNIFQ